MGTCDTAAMLGRLWGHKEGTLQVQSTALTRASASGLKGHRHQMPSTPKAKSHESTVAEMPNAELSLLLSAFGQSLKLQLLEG